MGDTLSIGTEIWRGGVNTWDCDEMGHMNVRHYVVRAMEGLAGMAAELGLPHAFTPYANATLLVKEHHIRFLREAHAGATLHMLGGIIEMGESEAKILQLLVHSGTGELAATFQTTVVHATPREGEAFPWPQVARDRAAGAARWADGPDRAAVALGRERRAARAPAAQQQQAAGREAVRPERGTTLTQSIGSLPSLTGFAQIVGLALGAPEFQRR